MQPVGLIITLEVAPSGAVSGTFAFADSTPVPLSGTVSGTALTLTYTGGASTQATLDGDRLCGTYRHQNGTCPTWGGTIDLRRASN